MSQKTVQIEIPFQVIVDAIASLDPEEKLKLWQQLNQEITKHPSQKNNSSEDKPTGEILTKAEICDRYPREWVLIGAPQTDEEWNVIRGQVLAHSPDREEIDKALTTFKHIQSISIEYTGPIPEDHTIIL
jgi:hypothetical protein